MISTDPKPRPIVKWAGGKQSLAPILADHFPGEYGTYFEPFVGGASVLLEMAPRRAVVGDENAWLIDTYRAIRDDWRQVASILDSLKNTKEEYLRIRAIDPSGLPLERRAAYFVYLNKTCFRGLFRVNRKNQFNVPYGAYDRRYYDPGNMSRVAQMLKNVQLFVGDFELCLADAAPDDFIYFDPPYYKLGGYSDFNRYTKYQFRESDHLRLGALCHELDSRRIRWAVSNSDTPFIRTIFSRFRMIPVNARREINLNSAKRGISELLIVNYSLKTGRHVSLERRREN